MKFNSIIVKDNKNNNIELRSANISDAASIIKYLKITADETPYLTKEFEEVTLTIKDEQEFIQNKSDNKRELLLLAFVGEKLIGSCSIISVGNNKRYAHRCSLAIALYQEYCGRGIGKIMFETMLRVAKEMGYEQAELEVMSKNTNAINLYEKLGFKKFGIFPNNVKYKDGSYNSTYWMMKNLHT